MTWAFATCSRGSMLGFAGNSSKGKRERVREKPHKEKLQRIDEKSEKDKRALKDFQEKQTETEVRKYCLSSCRAKLSFELERLHRRQSSF